MPVPESQVPGIQRRFLGDITVTAVNDGYIVIPPEAVVGVTPSEHGSIFRASGRRSPFASSLNAYLVQSDDYTLLIDTGAGTTMGPDLGNVTSNLSAAGVEPEQIDIIAMTHLHPDHCGGLLRPDLSPAFPNAELIIQPHELRYWLDRSMRESAPESVRSTFEWVQHVVAAYKGQLRTGNEMEVAAGVAGLALPGHTPAHTGYLISASEERLLIWGDICHVAEIQVVRPDVTVVFDSEPSQAVATRRSIFERVAEEDLLVAGMHMPFPGFNRLAKREGAFVLQPQTWQYAPRIS